ncbi:MAG: amino acid permease [Myxococcales bacterium]|nr:amino acid permease [Myxococcales bacterium]
MKELERSLGLPAVIAISVSAMLGSGIFVLPGLAAAQAGPSVWLSYLLAGLCVLPAATCKAELATAMPTSGGTYVYLERIFGPLVGSVAGVALWASMLLKSAFALLGFGTYLLVMAELPLRPTALVLLVAISLLNVVGVRKVGKAQVVIVGLSLLGLGLLVAFGLPKVDPRNLEHSFPHGVTGLLAATGFVFVSYNGVTKVAAVAEEVKNPQRNLPLGILLSLGGIMIVYGLVTFTLVGNVPMSELGSDLKPIHTLAHHVGGSVAGKVAAVLGVVTMVSMANAGLLAASRFPFAMAREQLLPASLASVHRRYQTPIIAILITAAAMAIAISFFEVAKLAKLASSIVILLYVSENLAVVVFRESRVNWYKPTFEAPLYPWVPALGALSGVVLLFMIGPTVLLAVGLVTVPGLLTYLFYGRARARRRGVVGQRTKRADLLQTARPVDTEDALSQAEAVVALFGGERSPEMLVEVGGALAESGTVQVAHLTEVPEQMALDVVLEEDVTLRSLRRRSHAAADQQGAHLDFHAIVARDLVGTVHSVTSRTECHWLVMEWQGPSRKSLLPYNPIGWLINHLDTNLALVRDVGIRYVREILVYPEPGPHDALVVRTAAHLAQNWGAHVTLVRFVPDDAGEDQVEAEQSYLEQLELLVEEPIKQHVLRGKNLVTSLNSETAAFDLLVMGQADASLFATLRGTAHARIIKGSACSVLSLKTPRVQTHAALRRHASAEESQSRLMPFVAPGALQARVRVHRKEDLFAHVAQVFEAILLGRVNARVIQDALWEREKTQNTSVGRGVALPHATVADIPSYLGVFTTKAPLDYAGPDGNPVDVFFVTLCPPSDRSTHLELLREIAALTLKTDLLDRLRKAETAFEMREALEECCHVLDDADEKAREESSQAPLDTSVGTP